MEGKIKEKLDQVNEEIKNTKNRLEYLNELYDLFKNGDDYVLYSTFTHQQVQNIIDQIEKSKKIYENELINLIKKKIELKLILKELRGDNL